jgi:hypothetical protein
LVENFSDPEIDLLFKKFFEFYHPRFDIFGLLLDILDLAFDPVHVIVINGGEAVPLQTADIIGVKGY